LKDDACRPDGAPDLAANENFISFDVACNCSAFPYREMCTANIADDLAINLDLTATIREGQPYRLADVARSRETLISAWRRTGHLDVRVRSDVTFSEARDEAHVALVVEPGPRTIVEHVVLAGLDLTRESTVEREMALRPGEAFSFERVLESQRRLSSLGIFERVSISELDPGRERRRDVVVSVQEAPRTSWSWGIGYSEQDLLRGSVEVTRRNLGGQGRTVSAFARGSFRGSGRRQESRLSQPAYVDLILHRLIRDFECHPVLIRNPDQVRRQRHQHAHQQARQQHPDAERRLG
jgi:outer membrane protein assembly factor BamA